MEPLLLPWMIAGKKLEAIKPSAENYEIIVQKEPEFKLLSYSTRDSVEMVRLTFAYANIEFDDIKIEDIKKWNKMKKEMPPSMSPPMLDWNGKKIFGGDAIGRLVAKICNLAGQGIYEQAQADTIVGIIKDFGLITIQYLKGVFGLEKVDKERIFHEIYKPAVKQYFTILDEFATKSTRDGFLLPSGIRYADFGVANAFELVNALNPELVIEFTNVKELTQRVFALPQLQYYLNNRPALAHLKPSPPVLKLSTNIYLKPPMKKYCINLKKNNSDNDNENDEGKGIVACRKRK
uniref:Glutathione S-transferase n=1 Tax=Panagrolaimus sp. PS1159 TaxID=55785 RepID=A0AC35EZU6_9BILA